MARFLDRKTGVGLVFANMVGAGVLLSAGFMAQDLTASQILWSWVVGTVIAMAGARAYAELAGDSGKSGGEYRYLSDYVHPFFGHFAGWASLFVGFSAAIAISAFGAVAFLGRVVPDLPVRLLGSLIIAGLAAAHAFHLSFSRNTQNGLVAIKIVFIVGFAIFGLAVGSWGPIEWTPPGAPADGSFPWKAFLANQYWVAFAFSGWNAAIYAASEFENPKRDVPFACLAGCLIVGLLYLVLNWIFVVNLTPESAAAVFQHDETRITLAHVVAVSLAGETAGAVVSIFAALLMLSGASAMMLVGPRVYAEMADDGVLPKWFGSREDKPPAGSVLLQGTIAITLLVFWSVLEVVQSAGAVLMLSSALTVLGVFALARRGRARAPAVVAAVIYVVAVAVLLVVGSVELKVVGGTLAFLLVVTLISFALRHLRTRDGT